MTLHSSPARLYLRAAADTVETIEIELQPAAQMDAGGGCIVEVSHAAVNPSDVKAALGMMPSAVFPRVPGRDFSGTVVEGPARLLGLEVWGTGGDLGISRNGTHGRYLWLEQRAIREKPKRLTMAEAVGVGVPFVTAMQGFEEAGRIRPGNVVVITGANGKVGQAAVQIALWHNAVVIAVTRGRQQDLDYIEQRFIHVDAAVDDLEAAILDATNGRRADIVFNTVGSPYWDVGNKVLGKLGRQVFISTVDRAVNFNIFSFYRGRQRFVGVDSLALDCTESGAFLELLKAGFDSGALRPFPLAAGSIASLSDWRNVYRSVLDGARNRMLFDLSAASTTR